MVITKVVVEVAVTSAVAVVTPFRVAAAAQGMWGY
jgi:hypothetical protein